MDYFSIFIAEYLIYIMSVYVVIHVFLRREGKNNIQEALIVILSAVAAWVLAHLLKNSIAHPRPDLALAVVSPDSVYSFPSGHATYAFALAFAMQYFDTKTAKVLLGMAILVGMGRVLVGVHYWYDVVGGALLAYAVVYLMVYLARRVIR